MSKPSSAGAKPGITATAKGRPDGTRKRPLGASKPESSGEREAVLVDPTAMELPKELIGSYLIG
jgi:hypothetical protein